MSHSELKLDLDQFSVSPNNGCRYSIQYFIFLYHCFLCMTSINSRFFYHQKLIVSF